MPRSQTSPHQTSELVEHQPRVLQAIDEDLDHHGKVKKALRVQDGQWREAHSLGLPTVGWEPVAPEPEELRLGIGRRRTSAYVVYMFLVGRGYYVRFDLRRRYAKLHDLYEQEGLWEQAAWMERRLDVIGR